MLYAFWSVLVDLWHFFWGKDPQLDTRTLPKHVEPLTLNSPEPLLNIKSATNQTKSEYAEVFSQPELINSNHSHSNQFEQPGTVYLVSCSEGTTLLREAGLVFDGALMQIPFGQSMSLRRFIGQYAEVLVCGKTGYVKKDDITPHQNKIWPIFKTGELYDADSFVTRLVRLHIKDEFLAGALNLPLLGGEYVLMRLLRDRLYIPWPPFRPRELGQWHIILRGIHGVHSTIAPQTDTIMEWKADDGEGRVAYVEAVFPDGTIKISAVGLMVSGEYTESIVPDSIWREWRPVFINIR